MFFRNFYKLIKNEKLKCLASTRVFCCTCALCCCLCLLQCCQSKVREVTRTLCYETPNWYQVHPVSFDHSWDASTTSLESTGGQFNCLDMIQRETHLSIKSPTVDSECQNRNTTMKSKELSESSKIELWGGIELRKSIKQFRVLKVPKSTVHFIIRLFLELAIWPNEASNRARRTLVMEVTKNPMSTLTERQSSLAEMGESATRRTISVAFHKSRLYGGVARWKGRQHEGREGNVVWGEGKWQHVSSLQKGMWKTLRASDKILYGLMRWKLNSLAWMQSATSGGNQAQLITHPTPSWPWSMVVAASCYGDDFQRQGLGCLLG